MNAMRILIINPNTTAAMTRSIEAAARAVVDGDVEITAVNPESGPAAIQGPQDGEAALPGLFAVFDREIVSSRAHDACIIACFDDTGLAALKARSPVPVIGIGEAAFHAATLLGARFSVVTTLPVSVPVIAENIEAYGFARHCAKVRASGVAVLEIDAAPDSSNAAISAEIARAIGEDGPQSIVLGCAGMADLARTMEAEHGLPVIDGVAAAVLLAQALHRLRGANRA